MNSSEDYWESAAFQLRRYSVQVAEEGFGAVYGAEDYDSFLIPHQGRVVRHELDGGTTEVGHVSAYSLLADAVMEHGDCPVMVADSHTQDLYEMAEAVYQVGSSAFREELELEQWGGDVLFIAKLELDRSVRGIGLGHAVTYSVIRRFGAGRSLVLIKPFPLQFCGTLGKGATPEHREAFEAAQRRLQTYYGTMGFELLQGAPSYMVMDLDWRQPSWDAALASWRRLKGAEPVQAAAEGALRLVHSTTCGGKEDS